MRTLWQMIWQREGVQEEATTRRTGSQDKEGLDGSFYWEGSGVLQELRLALFFFETGSFLYGYLAQTGLRFMLFLPLALESWAHSIHHHAWPCAIFHRSPLFNAHHSSMLSTYWDPNANIREVHSYYSQIIAAPIAKLWRIYSQINSPSNPPNSPQWALTHPALPVYWNLWATSTVPAPCLPPKFLVLSLSSLPVLPQLSSKCPSSQANGSYKDRNHFYHFYPRDLQRYGLNWVKKY